MKYRKQFLTVLLFVFAVTTTFGRRSGASSRGGGSSSGLFSRLLGGSKSTSHSKSHTGTSSSYPKQTYSNGAGTAYGWRTGGNIGHSHYYNSPSSTTNWGSSHNSPSYHAPQNTFSSFQPVISGIAPSHHFHKSTSYVPIYIPSSRTYVHRHYTHDSRSHTPPPPPSERVVYKQNSSDPAMVVGFNNMIVYGVYEKNKHYVITVSEDLDEDMDDIPDEFLHTEESSLFEIVTLKPTTTTTTTTTSKPSDASEFTTTTGYDDEWTMDWSATLEALKTLTAPNKEAMESHDKYGRLYVGFNDSTDDLLNLNFGDMIH